MSSRSANKLAVAILLAFSLLMIFTSIRYIPADSGTHNLWHSKCLTEALERCQPVGDRHELQVANAQRYSIDHIPKFCSLLKSPKNELPVLSSGVTGYELNRLGKAKLLAQDDERVISYLWDHCDIYLRPPDGRASTYIGRNPSMGQDRVVRKLLGVVAGDGFYVESGALDGILSSNTFQFEKEHGWGLLLEPDPSNLKKLYGYHRNAWISHSCLSTVPFPQEVIFQGGFDLGRIYGVVDIEDGSVKESITSDGAGTKFNVQCFPLYSYLVALNRTTIDYFSLDIEGDELKVLMTIPFDKVLIKVISVEFLTSTEGEAPLRKFMETKDYITAHKFYHRNQPFDLIFVHKSVNVPTNVLKELSGGIV